MYDYDLVPDETVARKWRTWTLLGETVDTLYRVASKNFCPLGVSPEQARVLLIIATSPSPPTRIDISRIVGRKPHTVTGMLNRMQRAGLIRRIKDDENQKLVTVVMTKKGREMWKRALQPQLDTRLTSFLSSGEFAQLDKILEKLRNAALKELEEAGPT